MVYCTPQSETAKPTPFSAHKLWVVNCSSPYGALHQFVGEPLWFWRTAL